MAAESETALTQSGRAEEAGQPTQGITPALVREITEKVYALWLQDLRLERERLGAHGARRGHRYGRL
ncbi:MAG: hypothetical protein R3C14_44695 [Caldilineaceae bacterium]